MTEDKYWELERGELILVDTEDGNRIVEFCQHLYDGAFIFRLPGTYMDVVATRDQLIEKIDYR